MQNKSFNLVDEPWLKVLDSETQSEKMVSLTELFEHTDRYEQLAGDMKAQDLAILRFLLSILTTVYSRFDAQNEPYDWLELDDNYKLLSDPDDEDQDEIEDDLLDTWKNLYSQKNFSKIVTEYLKKYKANFDLFGDTPFYQVPQSVYDQNVEAKKKVSTGKGTVSVKQINRTISESNNSPSLFSPKSDESKNKINYSELARWLITYQNFTGVTDKTKYLTKEKFSVSAGWLYGLNPVYVKGKSLFETLMLNLVLIPQNGDFEYHNQKPIWEYKNISDYLVERSKGIFPNNLSELYTDWSRMLHIEWQDDQPQIFSAGLPKFEFENMPPNYIEPMTTWRINKDGDPRPATKSKDNLSVAMWRNFGNYVAINSSNDFQPGIIEWVHYLKVNDAVSEDIQLNLQSVTLVSDGNATSQSPYAEVIDNMKINADVLLDENSDQTKCWPARIEDTVLLTQQIGKYFYWFAKEVSELGNIKDNSYASKMVGQFYDALNRPFYIWLASLTNQDERSEKIAQWKNTLREITLNQAQNIFSSATTLEIKGNGSGNIFTVYNKFRRNVEIKLVGKKGAKNDDA